MQARFIDSSAPPTPRVLVISDDPVARAAFVERLEDVVVGAADFEDTEGMFARHGANVALWDLGPRVPHGDVRLVGPPPFDGPTVLLLPQGATTPDPIGQGGAGFLGRMSSTGALRAAIDGVLHGLRVLDPDLFPESSPEAGATPSPSDGGFDEELTRRELEVLERMAAGDSNRRIADKLGISPHTVKFHIAAILTKLGAHTRTEAVVRAIQGGLVML